MALAFHEKYFIKILKIDAEFAKVFLHKHLQNMF